MKTCKLSVGLTIAVFFLAFNLNSQTNASQITVGGYFDQVWDQRGNLIPLSTLKVELNQPAANAFVASTATMQCGFFKVYYSSTSGASGTSSVEVARRNTICEVLTNVSGLLGWNGTWPNNGYIKILIDDINNLVPGTSSTSVLGLGAAIFACPISPTSAYPGFSYNQVQKTFISKTDAWTNVINPIWTPVSVNGFYHGILGFNFNNPSINWNPVHTTTVSGAMDLYSVVLHELGHTLGFTSLISGSGNSIFGVSSNYYSIYDKHLLGPNNNPLLVPTSTATCNSVYGYQFNTAFGGSVSLQPGCSLNYTPNVTTCATACMYSSTNVTNIPVYTPGCFDGGGNSLSHLEDMCYPINNPSNNDQYFVMSNEGGNVKRYFSDEERRMLCDLGYSVGTVYSSAAAAASHTYNGSYACSGSTVYGINDGILNGTYIFTTTSSSTLAIPLSSLSLNDASLTTPNCAELVFNTGTLVQVGSNLIYTPPSNYFGPFLIRYVPKNASGEEGNVTYVYGFCFSTFCSSVSNCDMIANGGFELNANCGPLNNTTTATCWQQFGPSTSDLFVRNCTSSPTFSANLGLSTYASSIGGIATPYDSHLPTFNNNAIVGVAVAIGAQGVAINENIYGALSSPLMPGQNYVLKFWAYQFSGFKSDAFNGVQNQAFNLTQNPATIVFASSNQAVAGGTTSTFPSIGINIIATCSLSSQMNIWQQYTVAFTYTNSSPGNFFYSTYDNIGTSSALFSTNNSYNLYYTLFDDFSLKPAWQNQTFSLPSTQLCSTGSFTDLSQYVSVPGGTFTAYGQGTTTSVGISTTQVNNSVIYNFNSAGTLPNGNYTILYQYSDVLGCVQTLYQQVSIGNVIPGLQLAIVTPTTCVNQATLSVVNPLSGVTYTWLPSNSTGTSVVATNSVPVTYTAIASSTIGCSNTGTIVYQPNIPSFQLVPTLYSPFCFGHTITAVGTYSSVVWNPGNLTGSQVVVSPTSTTVYTAVATNILGCAATRTTSLPLVNQNQHTITAQNAGNCAFNSHSLSLLQPGNPIPPAYNLIWLPGNLSQTTIIVSPSVSTVYSVTVFHQPGCNITNTVLVQVNSPTLSFSSNSLCPTNICTVTAAGNYTSITWLPGAINSSTFGAMVSPTAIYTVVSNYANGCVSTLTFQLLPSETQPNYQIATVNSQICANTTETLQLLGTPSFSSTTWSFNISTPSSTTNVWKYTTSSASQATITIGTATGVITADVNSLNGCFYQTTLALVPSNYCCSTPAAPGSTAVVTNSNVTTFTASSVATSTTWFNTTSLGEPIRIASSFTVPFNTTLTIWPSEVILDPNVQITLAPFSMLRLIGNHLRTCGNSTWDGILVEDGARVQMTPYLDRPVMIEDAVTAVSINSTTTTQWPIVLNAANTIFNKNLVDIKVDTYLNGLVTSTAINIAGSVFSCRDFTFTTHQWPSTNTVSPGLRAATAQVNDLASPYLLQNAPIAYLKGQYSNQHANTAIELNNAGITTGTSSPVAFHAMDFRGTNPANFVLFDAHNCFVKSMNSNYYLNNSVFQNTQTFSVSGTPTIAAAITWSTNFAHNMILDLSATTSTIGNRFFNCHNAIYAYKPFIFSISKADFRSTHTGLQAISNLNLLLGRTGVNIVTNQVDKYEIVDNKFFNIKDAVLISFVGGMINGVLDIPYSWQTGYSGAYFRKLFVHTNTISPTSDGTFSGTTLNFVNSGVSITAPNLHYITTSCSCRSLSVVGNSMHRVFNGISINAVNGSAMTCAQNGIVKTIANNTISVNPDFVWSADQRGLSFTNSQCFPTTPTEAVQRIQGNKISGFGPPAIRNNSRIILAYFSENGAISGPGTIYPTPHILCNELQNAHQGFVFDGKNNNPSDWRGNTMQDLRYGMTYSANAIIGQQGNATNPTDNKWLGSWPSGNSYGIWTDLSNAASSKLYINPSSSNNLPPNLWGNPGFQSYAAVGNTLVSSGSYTCGQLNLQKQNGGISIRDDYANNEEYFISRSFTYRLLAVNDSMRTSDGGLNDFYTSLQDSTVGKFKTIEDIIGSNHPEDAEALLASLEVVTFNRAEQAYYDFYKVFLKYRAYPEELSPDDYDQLYEIGNRCPGIDGPAVFQARALLQAISGQVHAYVTDCGNGTGERAATQLDSEKKSAIFEPLQNIFLVYPNPADNYLLVKTVEGKKFNKIVVRDVTQRVCISLHLSDLANMYQLNFSLSNGLYFITLSNEKENQTGKFIIER